MDIPDNADWLFALSDLRLTWLTTGNTKLKSWLDGNLSALDSAQIQKACYEALVTFAPDTPKTHHYRRLIGADLYMATDNHDITKLQAEVARLRLDHGQVVEGCNRLERERDRNRRCRPSTRFGTPTDTSRRALRQPAASTHRYAPCWRGYPDRTRRRINHVPLHLPRG